jgi:hypothetical protein
MPAHFLRESGEKNKYIWTIFWFSTTNGVRSRLCWYHAEINWQMEIDKISGLTDEAEKHVII